MPARTITLLTDGYEDGDGDGGGSDELTVLRASWQRSLAAENKSPATVTGYLNTLATFRAFLMRTGQPRILAAITSDHCKMFIAEQLETRKAATAATRYRNLFQFFRWCVDEGELSISPMAGMKQPKVEEAPPPILTVDAIHKLLAVCAGKDFCARRDTAMIRLLVDCGMRRSELAGLRLTDINWQAGELTVHGKGNRVRICSFGKKAARDLDRYLRVRATHRHAATPWLWLPLSGAGPRLSGDGILVMIQRRARRAGIGRAWVHLFRHTFANMFLEDGGQEGELMHLGGWRDYRTMQHYARSQLAQRARARHKEISPGDRI